MILFFYIYLIIILLFIIIYFIYFIHIVVMGIRGLPSDQQMRQLLIKIITRYLDQHHQFIDLGCGQGHICSAVKKNFPQLTVIGLEKSSLQILIARLKTKLLKQNIHFIKTNIFQYNLSKTEILYIYLPRPIVNQLEQKLINELPSGAVLITNTICLPHRQPQEVIICNQQVKFFVYLF